jgi:hypothetical protein
MDAEEGDMIFIRVAQRSYSRMARMYQRSWIGRVAKVTKTLVIMEDGERFSRKTGWSRNSTYGSVATYEEVIKCMEKQLDKVRCRMENCCPACGDNRFTCRGENRSVAWTGLRDSHINPRCRKCGESVLLSEEKELIRPRRKNLKAIV